MELVFFKLAIDEKPLKCTVQRTGFLGFTAYTAKELGLIKDNYLLFAVDSRDINNSKADLYMIIYEHSIDGGCKMKHTGEYFSCNTKKLFDKINLDYKSNEKTFIYDIEKLNELYEGSPIYKLKYREINKAKRKKKNENIQ